MYYKAREITKRPFVIFDLVAYTMAELEALGYASEGTITDALVVAQVDLPSYTGGICAKKIQVSPTPTLVDRDSGEIASYTILTTDDTTAASIASKATELTAKTFTYDSHRFRLDQATINRCLAIFGRTPADTDIATLDGTYTLVSANIDAFKAIFYDAIDEVTAPSA